MELIQDELNTRYQSNSTPTPYETTGSNSPTSPNSGPATGSELRNTTRPIVPQHQPRLTRQLACPVPERSSAGEIFMFVRNSDLPQSLGACAGKHVISPVKSLSTIVRMFFGLLWLAVSVSVGAQQVCMGGDIDHLTTTKVAACKTKISDVRDAVKKSGAPAGWHFVVICDEAGWKDYASFSQTDAAVLAAASYDTDLQLHWTYLRGSQMDSNQARATAKLVSVALSNIPGHKGMPHLIPPAGTRSNAIATTKPLPPPPFANSAR